MQTLGKIFEYHFLQRRKIKKLLPHKLQTFFSVMHKLFKKCCVETGGIQNEGDVQVRLICSLRKKHDNITRPEVCWLIAYQLFIRY
jgi:hypothetical protein